MAWYRQITFLNVSYWAMREENIINCTLRFWFRKTLAAILVALSLASVSSAAEKDKGPSKPGDPVHIVGANYPKDAQKEKIEGPVTLHVTIAKDGKVKDITVVKGDPKLTGAAIDAVRRWRFQPFVQNGESVEGQRDVTINFVLPGSSSAAVCDPNVSLDHVGGGVHPPRPIYSPDPKFPDEAQKSRPDGNVVVLSVVVNSTGRPCDIKIARSLGKEFDERAVDAVRQWLFQPATKEDGTAVAVAINVEVRFYSLR